jgi:hypothetical protein
MIEWNALTEIQNGVVRGNDGEIAMMTKRDKGGTWLSWGILITMSAKWRAKARKRDGHEGSNTSMWAVLSMCEQWFHVESWGIDECAVLAICGGCYGRSGFSWKMVRMNDAWGYFRKYGWVKYICCWTNMVGWPFELNNEYAIKSDRMIGRAGNGALIKGEGIEEGGRNVRVISWLLTITQEWGKRVNGIA